MLQRQRHCRNRKSTGFLGVGEVAASIFVAGTFALRTSRVELDDGRRGVSLDGDAVGVAKRQRDDA